MKFNTALGSGVRIKITIALTADKSVRTVVMLLFARQDDQMILFSGEVLQAIDLLIHADVGKGVANSQLGLKLASFAVSLMLITDLQFSLRE
ncbi:hypothetical protein T4D_3664 [Trichinella pseudospiralis]|uniref:Uncharacterized protein n=1 Tax=Trichinella pseudospiralis TaxID=6337 RepID=A0A0V1FU91_TRIPS|nr:hypothetical protein T4D_3664 [Trichinella pseudospiralis]